MNKILIIFFLFNVVNSQSKDVNSNIGLGKANWGLSLETADFGSGLSVFMVRPISEKFQLFGQFKTMEITGDGEMTVVDYWSYYPYKVNKFDLYIAQTLLGIKYHPFVGQIANNFSPYTMISIGPLALIDVPEYGKFKNKINNTNTYYNTGFVVGVGADFMIQSRQTISIFIGYDHLNTSDIVEGRNKYNGVIIKLMFGQNFK